jgi:hypothetical protein
MGKLANLLPQNQETRQSREIFKEMATNLMSKTQCISFSPISGQRILVWEGRFGEKSLKTCIKHSMNLLINDNLIAGILIQA